MRTLKVSLSLGLFLVCVAMISISCKTSSRYRGSASKLLSINDPQNIIQYVTGRKVVAVSSVSGCSSIVFPSSSEDLDDLESYGEIVPNNGITLSLDKSCLPYEVTLSYKCRQFEDGKYPAGRCFVGRASTFLGTTSSDTMRLEISLEGIGEWANIKIDDSESVVLKDFFTSDFLKNVQLQASSNKSLFILSGVQDIDVKSENVGQIKFSGASTSNSTSKVCGFEWDKNFTDVVIISKLSIDGKDISFEDKSFEQVLSTEVHNSVYIYGYSGSIENNAGNLSFMCESRVFRIEFGD